MHCLSIGAEVAVTVALYVAVAVVAGCPSLSKPQAKDNSMIETINDDKINLAAMICCPFPVVAVSCFGSVQ